MIHKVISGGQTGVDRAALDAARAAGLAIGGWCPAGRRAEDGPIDQRYPLRETPTRHYAQRTAWNVRDSDATLVLHRGEVSGGTALTIRSADTHGRPTLVLSLFDEVGLAKCRKWLDHHRVETLNVAGPREALSRPIFDAAYTFLVKLFRVRVPYGDGDQT